MFLKDTRLLQFGRSLSDVQHSRKEALSTGFRHGIRNQQRLHLFLQHIHHERLALLIPRMEMMEAEMVTVIKEEFHQVIHRLLTFRLPQLTVLEAEAAIMVVAAILLLLEDLYLLAIFRLLHLVVVAVAAPAVAVVAMAAALLVQQYPVLNGWDGPLLSSLIWHCIPSWFGILISAYGYKECETFVLLQGCAKL